MFNSFNEWLTDFVFTARLDFTNLPASVVVTC